MLLLERQPIYWRLVDPELEEVIEGPSLAIDDFILGPFDTECLSKYPPESDWSDWFPPPRPMTEWELYQLTDWVEIEAEKQNLFLDLISISERRNMTHKMTELKIPVPPAPILELAVGYQNNRDARYLALWWEPSGDEAMVSDGFVTFTGHWPGYLAYIHSAVVYPFLASYNLGSSDDQAAYHLVIDLQERKVFVARNREAEMVLAGQWKQEVLQTEPISVSADDFDTFLLGFAEQMEKLPTMGELENRMEEDRKAVEALLKWLDGQVK